MNSEDIVFLTLLLLQGCRTFKTALMSCTVSTLEEIFVVNNLTFYKEAAICLQCFTISLRCSNN